jgi:hypothetical protein
MGAIQQHRVAEHLRDIAVRAGGDRVGRFVPIDLGAFADLDLDELVIGERAIDSGDEPVVDPILADLHDGAQLVTEGSQVTALLSGEHAAL